jgi:hypothetical protein
VTGLLKDLMHDRADRLAQPVLDLEAITRDGERRVRRRRVVGGFSGLAAVVTLAALAPVVLDGRDAGDDKNNVGVSESAAVTWAEGDVIHADSRAYEIGHDIHAFVATGAGYVVVDPDGAVWSWTGGPAERVGTALTDTSGSSAELVADGAWAGWIDASQNTYVFLDQATETIQSRPISEQAGDAADAQPRMFAIDGATAYVRDQRGMVTINLGTEDVAVIGPLIAGSEIDDVEGGLILHSLSNKDKDVTVASRDLGTDEPALDIRGGDISPGGRYVMSENSATNNDTFTLLQLADGKELTPAIARDYDFFLGYAWADDNTYSAFGLQMNGRQESSDIEVDLLECQVGTRSCEVLGDGPADINDFEIPVGMHIGDD